MISSAVLSTLALVTAGCGNDSRAGTALPHQDPLLPRGSSGTSDGADVALVVKAIGDEQRLLNFCTAAARSFSDDKAMLTALASRQRAHVTRLRAALTDLHPATTHMHAAVPAAEKAFTTALRSLIGEARDSRTADCQAADAGLLAELFACLAASHAMTALSLDPRLSTMPVPIPSSVAPVDPLQGCLAAEHAALFGYALLGGVLGAGTSTSPVAELAVAAYDEHRRRRDSLAGLIDAGGATPVAADASYATPFRIGDPSSARHLARVIEARSATVYAQATAVLTGAGRMFTSAAVADCATRGQGWGTLPTAFPGLAT